jgi:hypothetical protein
MIQSPYTITLVTAGEVTPIVLVAAGGWLDALPVFEASQELFESDGVTLGDAFFRPMGGVTVTLTLAVEADHDDLLEALEAFLEEDATTLQTADTLLHFTPQGGGAATVFSDVAVTVQTTDLPSGPTSTTLRTITLLTTLPD